MLGSLLVVVLGGVAILVLAELLVGRAMALSRHHGWSGGFLGLTVLSVGTSIPEVLTHIVGSVDILAEPERMDALSGLLLGNSIGSNNLQQIVLLPLVSIFAPIAVKRGAMPLTVGGLVFACGLLWLMCLGDGLGRVEGIVLVGIYAAYLWAVYRDGGGGEPMPAQSLSQGAWWTSVVVLPVGFVGMGAICDQVLVAAEGLVTAWGVSSAFVGVVLLGVLSALPELGTAVSSLWRGEREASAGVLLGSNVTNPLLAAGGGAALSGYSVDPVFVWVDLPANVVTGAFIYAVMWKTGRLGRGASVVLILSFGPYLYLRGLV